MFTINVMAHYESRLGGGLGRAGMNLAFMIVFVPLCLSVGGNAGSQASTLVTRALALEQIRTLDWLRVFHREFIMAASLAAALGVLAIVRTYLWTPGEVLSQLPDDRFWDLIWVVTFSIMGICLTGALVGAMLPLLIKWLGGDPALMSGPFIATLSDVLGIVIYFNVVAAFF
jgi:magnesium transporter